MWTAAMAAASSTRALRTNRSRVVMTGAGAPWRVRWSRAPAIGFGNPPASAAIYGYNHALLIQVTRRARQTKFEWRTRGGRGAGAGRRPAPENAPPTCVQDGLRLKRA